MAKFKVPYFQTPNEIFEMDLKIHEKIVYIYLCRCGNEGKDAFPSYKTIATKCSIGKSTAIKCMNKLVELGLVIKQHRYKERENNSNIYKVNYGLSGLHGGVGDVHGGVGYLSDTPNKELDIKNYKKRTNIYITLASDDPFISFYLSTFTDFFNKQHMRVRESNLDTIEESLEVIKEVLSYQEYCDMVIEYFEQIPANNNGNILSFCSAKERYLTNGCW